MTQPFADALTWIPKSRALGSTLSRAYDLARAQGHAEVTLEHSLLALIEDADAAAVLLACNIDLLHLNSSATTHLQALPAGEGGLPRIEPGLLRILEFSVAAARQSRRSEVNGAIVLAAIVGEGKSEAARLLQAHGLTFQDTVRALQRTNAPRPAPAAAADETATATATAEAATGPEANPGRPYPPPPPAPNGSRQAPFSAGDDPITTARRRIDAMRSGGQPVLASAPQVQATEVAPTPPALVPAEEIVGLEPAIGLYNGSVAASVSVAAGAAARHVPLDDPAQLIATVSGPQAQASDDWAPPSRQVEPAPIKRATRMPPPVPPMLPPGAGRTPGSSYVNGAASPRADAPWADATGTGTTSATNGEHAVNIGPARWRDAGVDRVAPDAAKPAFDPERLIESFPERMRRLIHASIEVRLPRAVISTIAANPGAGRAGEINDGPRRTAGGLHRTLTLRLKATRGLFTIETAAPETQWFDATASTRADDEARWRWIVTPQRAGRHDLLLSASLRVIGPDGLVVETALPDQAVEIVVGHNWTAGLAGWVRTFGTAIAGAALGLLAGLAWPGLLAGPLRLFGL